MPLLALTSSLRDHSPQIDKQTSLIFTQSLEIGGGGVSIPLRKVSGFMNTSYMLCSSMGHCVPYILPNRGQNKDTICSLLLLVFCMNCSGPSPISSCSVSSTGWLVLALYHNLSPVTIFPSLCYRIVSGLSGTGECFLGENFLRQAFNCRPSSRQQWWGEGEEEQLQIERLSWL